MADVNAGDISLKLDGDFQLLQALELMSARKKHPGTQASAHEAFAVLLEEVDEFKAEVWKKGSERSKAKMLAELVQIAAMAQRAAEDLKLIEG